MTETCTHPDCDESLEDTQTYVDTSGARYCSENCLLADANGWRERDGDLQEWEVEHDGIEGTFRAPSQADADMQWRAMHFEFGK